MDRPPEESPEPRVPRSFQLPAYSSYAHQRKYASERVPATPREPPEVTSRQLRWARDEVGSRIPPPHFDPTPSFPSNYTGFTQDRTRGVTRSEDIRAYDNVAYNDRRVREDYRDHRMRENHQDYRMRENHQDYRMRENHQDYRMRENHQDYRMRENHQDYRMREDSRDNRMRENHQDYRVREDYRDHRMRENHQDYRMREDSRDNRMRENHQDYRMLENHSLEYRPNPNPNPRTDRARAEPVPTRGDFHPGEVRTPPVLPHSSQVWGHAFDADPSPEGDVYVSAPPPWRGVLSSSDCVSIHATGQIGSLMREGASWDRWITHRGEKRATTSYGGLTQKESWESEMRPVSTEELRQGSGLFGDARSASDAEAPLRNIVGDARLEGAEADFDPPSAGWPARYSSERALAPEALFATVEDAAPPATSPATQPGPQEIADALFEDQLAGVAAMAESFGSTSKQSDASSVDFETAFEATHFAGAMKPGEIDKLLSGIPALQLQETPTRAGATADSFSGDGDSSALARAARGAADVSREHCPGNFARARLADGSPLRPESAATAPAAPPVEARTAPLPPRRDAFAAPELIDVSTLLLTQPEARVTAPAADARSSFEFGASKADTVSFCSIVSPASRRREDSSVDIGFVDMLSSEGDRAGDSLGEPLSVGRGAHATGGDARPNGSGAQRDSRLGGQNGSTGGSIVDGIGERHVGKMGGVSELDRESVVGARDEANPLAIGCASIASGRAGRALGLGGAQADIAADFHEEVLARVPAFAQQDIACGGSDGGQAFATGSALQGNAGAAGGRLEGDRAISLDGGQHGETDGIPFALGVAEQGESDGDSVGGSAFVLGGARRYAADDRSEEDFAFVLDSAQQRNVDSCSADGRAYGQEWAPATICSEVGDEGSRASVAKADIAFADVDPEHTVEQDDIQEVADIGRGTSERASLDLPFALEQMPRRSSSEEIFSMASDFSGPKKEDCADAFFSVGNRKDCTDAYFGQTTPVSGGDTFFLQRWNSEPNTTENASMESEIYLPSLCRPENDFDYLGRWKHDMNKAPMRTRSFSIDRSASKDETALASLVEIALQNVDGTGVFLRGAANALCEALTTLIELPQDSSPMVNKNMLMLLERARGLKSMIDSTMEAMHFQQREIREQRNALDKSGTKSPAIIAEGVWGSVLYRGVRGVLVDAERIQIQDCTLAIFDTVEKFMLSVDASYSPADEA